MYEVVIPEAPPLDEQVLEGHIRAIIFIKKAKSAAGTVKERLAVPMENRSETLVLSTVLLYKAGSASHPFFFLIGCVLVGRRGFSDALESAPGPIWLGSVTATMARPR